MSTPPRSRPAMILVRAALAPLAALAATAPSAARGQPPTTAQPVAATEEYTILIYESAAQLAARTSPGAADAYWSAYDEFAAALAKAGALRGGSALDERVARTVRGRGTADDAVRGARLGGYFVIATRDRAEAEAWARRAPSRAIAVEVRPHRPNPHMAAMRPPAAP